MACMAVENALRVEAETPKRIHEESSDAIMFAEGVNNYCNNDFKTELDQIVIKEVRSVRDVCHKWAPHCLKTNMMEEAKELLDPDSYEHKVMGKIVKERTSEDFIKDNMDGSSKAMEFMPHIDMYSLSEKTTLTQLTYLCTPIAGAYASLQKIIKKLDDFEDELKLFHNHSMWWFIKTLVNDIPDCRIRVNEKLKELFLPVKKAALDYIKGTTNKPRRRALLQAMSGFADRHVPEDMIEKAEMKDLIGFQELLDTTLMEHKVWKQRRRIESFVVGYGVMKKAWTSQDTSMKEAVRVHLVSMKDDKIDRLINLVNSETGRDSGANNIWANI